jgi:Undecaprenyl-phosphate glucose phosphotransferase
MNQLDPNGRFASSASTPVAAPAIVAVPRPQLNETARQIAASYAAQSLSARLIGGLTRIADVVALVLAAASIYAVWVYPVEGADGWYALPVLGGALLFGMLLSAARAYTVPALRTPVAQLGRTFASWTLVFAIFAVVAFFLKSGTYFSRAFFASWYLAGIGWFLLSRIVIAARIRRWTRERRLERRAVIVGGGATAAELIEAIEAQPGHDISICGIFDDRRDERSPSVVAGYPKIGTVAELVEFGRLARIDLLIVSLPITAENRLLQVLKQLWVLPVDVRLSAYANKVRFRPRAYSHVGSVPFLDVFDKPIAEWDSLIKRAFDIVVASLAMLVFSPLMLAAAIAIRLDSPGPVLFRQKRYGFNNEIINVYKFRSMYHDRADPGALVAVTRSDPRVTRVGRFIRRTSIDELPQFFNVLRGELSLVGPRPHAITSHTGNKLWDEVVDGYFARHRVKPGVTGWAQINGWRGEADTPEKIRQRVAFDLHYIENWSVLFDLYILAMTPFRLLGSGNAY